MKRKLLYLLPISIASISLLAGCGSSCNHDFGDWHADAETGLHVRYCSICGEKETGDHQYDDGVITKEATCLEDGVLTHVCSICHGIREEVISKTNEHHYDTYVSHDERNHTVECSVCGKTTSQQHSFVLSVPHQDYLKEAATCDKAATYYKSCACGYSSKGTVYEETFTYGKPAEHNIYNLKIKSAPTKLSYYSLEEFDPTGLVLTYSCYDCKDTNLEATYEDGITFTYQNANSSFRVGETSIQANFLGKSVKISGITVSKAKNSITGLEDMEVSCLEDIDLNKVISSHGKVEIVVLDKNGDEVEGEELHYALEESLSPYTVKASVTGTKEYEGVETKTATINVHHAYELDSIEGVSKCACSSYAVNKYFYDISTKEFYLDAVYGEKADIALDGTVIDPETGNKPDLSTLEAKEQKVLKATKDNEVVYFYVTAISRVLTSQDDLNQYLWAKDEDVSGYYVLGNDIDEWITNDFEGVNATGGANFTATLDGAGHHINTLRLSSKYGGLFGTRNLSKSLLTDIYFDDIKTITSNGGIFGYVGDHITLQNCYFAFGKGDACLFASAPTYSDNKIIDCTIDFDVYEPTFLYYQAGGSNDKTTFENTTILYTKGKTQTITRNVPTSHDEEGIIWIEK